VAVLIESELPRYICHKEVGALKITAVVDKGCGVAALEVDPPRFGPIYTDAHWLAAHAPKPGGYLVFYKDGFRSYSPAKAFEEGYTLKREKVEQLLVMLPPDPTEADVRRFAAELLAQVPKGARIVTLPFPPGLSEEDAAYRNDRKVRVIRQYDPIYSQMCVRLDVGFVREGK
jgi:hypothetical protein